MRTANAGMLLCDGPGPVYDGSDAQPGRNPRTSGDSASGRRSPATFGPPSEWVEAIGWMAPEEVFPGAGALLLGTDASRRAILRGVARLTVIAAAVEIDRDGLTGEELRNRRATAARYVRLVGPRSDPTRRALLEVLSRLETPSTPAMTSAILDAAAEASTRGEQHGAGALARAAHRIASRHRWRTLSARAAAALAVLARDNGDRASAERWQNWATSAGQSSSSNVRFRIG